ncbi:MAG: rubrerythrin, partial [Desulfobacteraceae bacterium]
DSIEDIVKLAIMLEKESILFYLGIKDLVPPKYGQDKIDDIIREEQKHIIQLNGFLKKAQKS